MKRGGTGTRPGEDTGQNRTNQQEDSLPRTAKAAAPKQAALAVVQNDEPALEGKVLNDWFAPIDEVIDFTNSLFYGREGSGKTTSLARMANVVPGKVLIINAEGGVKKAPLKKRGVNTDNIVIFPNPDNPLPLNHRNLNRLFRKIKSDLMDDPNSWSVVGFDSITEVYQCVLDDVQATRVKILKDKGAEPDPFFVDISDYGTMSKMVRDLLRKFRDLPVHTVFTALERRDIDKDTGKPQYGPDVTPALQKDVLGYVDMVLMFKAADEMGPYRALTRANSRYRAKDRFDVLPKVMAEPMGDRIIQYVQGELIADEDPFQIDLTEAAIKSQDVNLDDDDEDEDDDESDD